MPDTKKEHPDIESENKFIKKTPNFVGWAVFVFTISIVIISLISVVFPALIASNNSTAKALEEFGVVLLEVDAFQAGIWAASLLAANFIVFVIAVLYFKKRLPESIKNAIDFVFSFEVSKKVAFIALAALLVIYVGASAGELAVEEEWEDYVGLKKRVDNWSPDQVATQFEPHVRYFLLWSSLLLFGNYAVIPFLASISLVLLTYFFTVKLTKKRFAGIVSTVILLQSNIFLTYDTTVSYTNFWIVFYLLSLYLIFKAWPLSPVSYFLSIPSKAMTVMFFPMSLFFIYRTNISRIKKIIVAASTTAIILAGLIAASVYGINLSAVAGTQDEFDSDEFWLGFTSFSYQLRFDGLVLLFILPLVVGLFIASRHGFKHAESMMVLLGGMLLIAPLITGYTDQTNQPYRFVPFVVFFAISVGVLLSRRKI